MEKNKNIVKVEKKTREDSEKVKAIKFNILAIVAIVIFCISLFYSFCLCGQCYVCSCKSNKKSNKMFVD